LEQEFIPRKEFRQGVQEQAFAEAARAGEEIRFALADLGESLDADGEFLAGHGKLTGERKCLKL
jgi:hypothetical protein